MKKKVFVVGTAINYANFINDVELVDKMADADIVLFTGGEDVNPKLYKSRVHPATYCNPARDEEEKAAYNKIKSNQLALGICRGSQFLCVMNGGKLVQDCENHAMFGTHGISDGETIYEITSTHHQMQYPYNLKAEEYDVLFKAEPSRSYCHLEGYNLDVDTIREKGEPEIVLYHKENKPRALAIQGHPEYMRKDSPVVIMLNELIDKLLQNG